MYRRILLAYDGSREGRAALKEGALLARSCDAAVFLLSVDVGASGVKLAEATCGGALDEHRAQLRAIIDEGVARLADLGLAAVSRIVEGDPTEQICAFAYEIAADLVVVGHRRQTLLERWWSGPSGAYLSDRLTCSLLIARSAEPGG